MNTVLSVVPAGTGKSLDLDPKTPFIGALEQRLTQGMDLLNAVRDLMGMAGMLGGAADPALVDLGKIKSAITRLREAGLIIEEPMSKHVRLSTLGDPADPIELKLEASASRDTVRGNAAIALSANASLELILDVLAPAEAAKIGLPLATADVLHRCHFGGNLGTEGSVKAPQFELSAGLELGAGVTWHFERHRHDTVLGSLVDAALELSNGIRPWELDDVRRVLEQPKQPGRHLDALRAIDVRAERTLSVAGKLTLQRGFIREASVNGANGPQAIQLALGAKASFGFTASRTGEFNLRLTRDGEDVLLELTKTRSASRGREFKAGVEIGINGLDTLAQGWLDKLLPALDEDLRGKLDAWSRPGDALVAKLKDKLGKKWGERLLPLAELVLGETSAADAAEALSAQLIKRWAGMLDERIELLGSSAERVAARLLNEAASDSDLESKARATIHAALVKAIEAQQADTLGEIDAYVAKLKGKTEDKLTDLLRPLEAMGKMVQDLVTAVDTNASAVAAEIEKLLTKYEGWRKALTAVAQKAAALKVGVNFAASSSFESGESRQLLLRFTPATNDEANALFRRLVLGQGTIDLAAFDPDVIDASKPKVAGVVIEKGGFSAYAKGGRSMSLSLDLFGLNFSDVRIFGSEVEIDVDASGRVRLFKGKAEQFDFSNNPRTAQSASFSADFDLISADPDRLPGTLGLAFELVGKEQLKPKALAQFLASFVDAGMVRAEQAAAAALRLDDGSDGPLAVGVSLNRIDAALAKAAFVPATSLREDALRDCLRFMRKRADPAGRLIPKLPFNTLLDAVQRASTKSGADRAAHDSISAASPSTSLAMHPGSVLSQISREYRALHRAIVCIPASVNALADIGRLAEFTQSHALSDDEARQARDRLDALLQALQTAASPAVNVSDAIFRLFSERLPDRTVALLAAIARLGAGSEFHAQISLHRISFNKQGQRVLGERLGL